MITLKYPFVVRFVTTDVVEVLRDVEYTSPIDVEPDFIGFEGEAEMMQYIEANEFTIFTPEDDY